MTAAEEEVYGQHAHEAPEESVLEQLLFLNDLDRQLVEKLRVDHNRLNNWLPGALLHEPFRLRAYVRNADEFWTASAIALEEMTTSMLKWGIPQPDVRRPFQGVSE